MREPVYETVTAVRWLDRLAAALEAAGCPCETRYLEVPALLQVRHPEVAGVWETVTAVHGPSCAVYGARTWWFRCPAGLIGECGDLRRAVTFLGWMLTAKAAVLDGRRPGRGCGEGGHG